MTAMQMHNESFRLTNLNRWANDNEVLKFQGELASAKNKQKDRTAGRKLTHSLRDN